jgi:hypothetical protein
MHADDDGQLKSGWPGIGSIKAEARFPSGVTEGCVYVPLLSIASCLHSRGLGSFLSRRRLRAPASCHGRYRTTEPFHIRGITSSRRQRLLRPQKITTHRDMVQLPLGKHRCHYLHNSEDVIMGRPARLVHPTMPRGHGRLRESIGKEGPAMRGRQGVIRTKILLPCTTWAWWNLGPFSLGPCI